MSWTFVAYTIYSIYHIRSTFPWKLAAVTRHLHASTLTSFCTKIFSHLCLCASGGRGMTFCQQNCEGVSFIVYLHLPTSGTDSISSLLMLYHSRLIPFLTSDLKNLTGPMQLHYYSCIHNCSTSIPITQSFFLAPKTSPLHLSLCILSIYSIQDHGLTNLSVSRQHDSNLQLSASLLHIEICAEPSLAVHGLKYRYQDDWADVWCISEWVTWDNRIASKVLRSRKGPDALLIY